MALFIQESIVEVTCARVAWLYNPRTSYSESVLEIYKLIEERESLINDRSGPIAQFQGQI